jgi:hypothetical protein
MSTAAVIPQAAFADTDTGGSVYTAVAPFRVLDTQNNVPSANVSSASDLTLQVRKTAVPANATAVVMTLNAWSITQDSTVTVYPSDQAIPVSPSLTLNVGMDASNTIITPVDADGTVTVHLSAGTIQASMDVSGYYTPTDGTGGYYPVTPSRLGTLTMTGSGDTESVQVTGRAGVPDAATSVALSVSVKDPTAETPFSV